MKCSKCNQEKTPEEFYKDKRTKSGLYSACRKCHLSVLTTGNGREYMREYMRQYRTTLKYKSTKKKYEKEHPDKIIASRKKWSIKNKEYFRKYRDENRESLREYAKKHRDENNETYRKYWKTSYKKKKKDPNFRIDDNMSRSIGQSLKGKKAGRSWEKLVGYSVEDLIKHLENKFELWMTWDNYGKWHIDHIRPQSLFNYKNTEDEQFKQCWALENLQPLEAIANMKKGNKFTLDKEIINLKEE